MVRLEHPFCFDWDAGNQDKNYIRHNVTNGECEEVFFDPHKRLLGGPIHCGQEERRILLGRTKGHRILFIVFTQRGGKIRVISARDLSKKERQLYEKDQRSKIQE